MTTLLIAMSRADTVYGTHPVRYAVLSGQQVLKQGLAVADELHGLGGRSMRLALDSPANVTERLRVRALSRRFVPVLVQRQLVDNGSFTERFRCVSQVHWLRQGEAEVDAMAMLEEDAELPHQLLPTHTRPLTHLVTAERAVAALIHAVTKEAVLVHWWQAGMLRTLGVQQGAVIWQRVQPMGGTGVFTGDSDWKPLLEAATSTAPLEFSGAHAASVRLGEGPWANTAEWASNGSRPLIDQLRTLFKGDSDDQVLRHPDLFGLPHLNRHDTLIQNGYRQRVQAWQWAPWWAGAAAAVGAVLLGWGFWAQWQSQQLEQSLQFEQAGLQRQVDWLQQRRPPAEAVKALRSAAWREAALGANLRVDRFLEALLTPMPEGAQVQLLHIERNGSAAEKIRLRDGQPDWLGESNRPANRRQAKRPASPPPEEPVLRPAADTTSATASSTQRRMPLAGEPSFLVDLDIRLAGSYASAKLRAEALAEHLTRLGRISDTRLTFEDAPGGEPGARLRTRLTIAAGAF